MSISRVVIYSKYEEWTIFWAQENPQVVCTVGLTFH